MDRHTEIRVTFMTENYISNVPTHHNQLFSSVPQVGISSGNPTLKVICLYVCMSVNPSISKSSVIFQETHRKPRLTFVAC